MNTLEKEHEEQLKKSKQHAKKAKYEFYFSITCMIAVVVALVLDKITDDKYNTLFQDIYFFIVAICIIRVIYLGIGLSKLKKEMRITRKELEDKFEQLSEEDKQFMREMMPWRFKK